MPQCSIVLVDLSNNKKERQVIYYLFKQKLFRGEGYYQQFTSASTFYSYRFDLTFTASSSRKKIECRIRTK